jgi:WD40 repeat protein
VTALAFSPDGATLASASKQGTLKLWNLSFLRAELRKLGLDW